MDKQIITKAALRKVLSDYGKQYRKHPVWFLFSFFVPAIGSVFVFFVPPLLIAKIVNLIAAKGDISFASVGRYIALFAGLWLFGEACWRVGIYFLNKLETEGIRALGKEAFLRLTERDYDFYTNHFVGSLTKKSISFHRGFEIFTDTLCFSVLPDVIPVIFASVVLWRYSPWLTVALLACICVAAAVGLPIIRKRMKLVAERHDAGSRISGRMSDSITNMLAIKSFATEERERRDFEPYVDDYAAKIRRATDFQNFRFDMAMSPLYVGSNALGLIAAVFFTQKLGLEAGAMVVIFSYYSNVTRTFWGFNKIYRNIEASVSEAAEFTQLTLEAPKVRDAADAGTLSVSGARIEFKGVGFGYDADAADSARFLSDFNLSIESGQRVGLVGPSGGGKTTITKLLLRFIDLSSGKILIDGQDIAAVTQASLREAVAYVPQEPLLFHRSLSENIAYGNERATEDDVVRAAKLARADEFIARLPHGYDTLVGERGIKLSGGQRQRIAIARAISKDAPILVLDEATSALDSESEKYIQEGLRELMKGKTALIIAHRLSTIKHLDRIIVLDQGKIVQDGTHAELIKQKGLYAKLWSHQSGEFIEA